MEQAPSDPTRPSVAPGRAEAAQRIRARSVIASAWEIYRKEILGLVSTTAVVRASVTLATVVLVEGVLTALHLVSLIPVGIGYAEGQQQEAFSLISLVFAGLGHFMLVGVLERVVGAHRHGHPRPGIRETFSGLPWLRLIAADVMLTFAGVVLLMACAVPLVLARPFAMCVMPLISMRHENLRTVWKASYRLVKGNWLPVLVVGLVATIVDVVLLEGGSFAIGHLIEGHVLEIIAHGTLAIFILPFSAIIPVIVTFDLLERHGEVPTARY